MNDNSRKAGSRFAKFAMAGLAAGVLGWTPSASAVQTIYSGYDVGGGESVRLSTFANATSARNSFLGGLVGVGTESFESYPTFTGAPLAVNFGAAGVATLNGNGSVRRTSAGQTNGVGRYATDGDAYWEASSVFNLSFSAPVAAFGFMGIDIGDFGGQVTMTTSGGLNQVFNVGNPTNTAGGGVMFWGVIDTVNTWTSISFGNTRSGTDFFAFDQMTIGSLQQVANPVPEPETYAMMLAGLGLLGVVTRRRKQKAIA